MAEFIDTAKRRHAVSGVPLIASGKYKFEKSIR
jgi:hypothetical protein